MENPQKTNAQELLPRDETERLFFEHLDSVVDVPIKLTIKRINRIAQSTFEDCDLQTAESCSGHTDSKGEVLADSQPIVFFMVNTEANREKVIPTFRKIFTKAVAATNMHFNNTVIMYGASKRGQSYTPEGEYLFYGDIISADGVMTRPSFSCEAEVLMRKNVDQVLKIFWDEIDKALSEIDNLNIASTRTIESFHRTLEE